MTRGGTRQGAGRPKGSGRYGEPTKAIRVPISKLAEVMEVLQERSLPLPLFSSAVAAGFPSPADDEVDRSLDLNEYLIKRPASTFFVRVAGESMIQAGIHDGDILIVDRSIEPKPGKIVIAAVHGELTVKRLHREGDRWLLIPENPAFSAIELPEDGELHIWGVVTNVIHHV
ncbi:MAG: translesion error-prone DNA polymerase V autoproteolytic subunit [Chlamydiales bacterium]